MNWGTRIAGPDHAPFKLVGRLQIWRPLPFRDEAEGAAGDGAGANRSALCSADSENTPYLG